MKKLFLVILSFTFISFSSFAFADEIISVKELKKMNIQTNSPIKKSELEKAEKIMTNIHNKTLEGIKNGKGPFYAEIYNKDGNLVAATSNSVVETNCALNHAEMNALKNAFEKYKNYDLSKEDLTIYINAEPCVMCAGGLMWSGVKTIYYSVPSHEVEKITGFDEGYKPNWIKEFKKRGIVVYGNIQSEQGKKVLEDYVKSGKEIYKPQR